MKEWDVSYFLKKYIMKVYEKTIVLVFFLFVLSGCATIPIREGVSLKGPTYQIENIPYVPLTSVITAYGLDYNWDSIAKKLTLYHGNKEAVLCVGSGVALVNGMPESLNGPIRMHRSVIILPKDFASTSLAKLFIEKYKVTKPEIRVAIPPPGVYTIKKIVIDPGHGGKDPGAIGQFGLVEKDITLDIARRLKRYLENSDTKVILTRDDDRFISLWERANIANREDADFFISIHANAFRSKQIKGFEVYYLSEAIDDNARAVAAAENASLRYEKSSFGNRKPSSVLEATLWDIEYTENRQESIELAERIAGRTYEKLDTKNRGVKAARFYVLKGAKMPSVLIEVGFISNRQEARKLISSEYREASAKAIASGIMGYKKEYEVAEGFTR